MVEGTAFHPGPCYPPFSFRIHHLYLFLAEGDCIVAVVEIPENEYVDVQVTASDLCHLHVEVEAGSHPGTDVVVVATKNLAGDCDCEGVDSLNQSGPCVEEEELKSDVLYEVQMPVNQMWMNLKNPSPNLSLNQMMNRKMKTLLQAWLVVVP